MDLSDYVTKTGRRVFNGMGSDDEEKIIKKDIMEKLLDAKDGMVHVFAVVTSIYNEENDIGGGFFATAYNTEHMLSKNYAPAEQEFKKIYNYLRNEHWLSKDIPLDRRKIKERNSSNVGCGKFMLNLGGSLEDLKIGIKRGLEAYTYGDKILVGLNSVYLSLDGIEYSDKHKSLCWTYEDYVTNYIPIILD